jgi:hypothetical protein
VLAGYVVELDRLAGVVTGILQGIVDGDRNLDGDKDPVERLAATAQRLLDSAHAALAAPTRGITTPRRPAAIPTIKVATNVLERVLDRDETARSGQRTMEGSSKSIPIASIFEFISKTRKSGTLRVKTSQEMLEFDFFAGDVVFTATDTPHAEQRLGDILLQKGYVGPEDLERFLRQHDSSPPRLGELLEKQELVTREQLVDALEHQVQQRFYRAFTAKDCTFEFYEGERPPADDRIRMSVIELLFESARTVDESKQRRTRTEPAAVTE